MNYFFNERNWKREFIYIFGMKFFPLYFLSLECLILGIRSRYFFVYKGSNISIGGHWLLLSLLFLQTLFLFPISIAATHRFCVPLLLLQTLQKPKPFSRDWGIFRKWSTCWSLVELLVDLAKVLQPVVLVCFSKLVDLESLPLKLVPFSSFSFFFFCGKAKWIKHACFFIHQTLNSLSQFSCQNFMSSSQVTFFVFLFFL